MLQKAATRGKTLSPAGHIREYSCVLSIRKDSAPEVGHKRMSEVSCLLPRRRGMSRPDAGAFYHPL
jgi:hypothetical protein